MAPEMDQFYRSTMAIYKVSELLGQADCRIEGEPSLG